MTMEDICDLPIYSLGLVYNVIHNCKDFAWISAK